MTAFDDMPLEMRRHNFGWFGEPWPSGICLKQDPETGADILPYEWDWDMNTPVPVGEKCFSCDEVIVEGDQGQHMPYADGINVKIVHNHRECSLRNVMGPLAHLERRCRCFGGTDHDTPGLTKRQEAIAVWEWIREHGVPSGP